MAFDLRDRDDPNNGSFDYHARFAKKGAHDGSSLPAKYRTDRRHVLALAYLWELDLSLSVGLIHSNAQGE